MHFAPSNLKGQNNVLSLEEVMKLAEKNYPGLLLYQSRIKAKDELAKGARALMPPSVSVGIDQFPYNRSAANMDDGMIDQSAIMLSAEQMFTHPAKLKARQQYQLSLAATESKRYEWTRLLILKEVKVLYYQRYVNEKKIRLLDESDRLLDLFLNTAEGVFPYNQSSLTTIFKAKAKREELSNMKLMVEAEISESNIGLNLLMGREADVNFNIDTSINISNNILTEVDSVTLLNRPDITGMETAIKAMELNRTLIGTSAKPDFGLRLTHMQMLDMPSSFSVMGMLTIPIAPWSSGMYKAETNSMNFEIEAMKQDKETMYLMSKRMSSEKLLMINSEKKQLDNYINKIIPAYIKNFETALAAYKQTTFDFFVLLDAWEMLLMKKLDAAEKQKALLRLIAEYEFETGK